MAEIAAAERQVGVVPAEDTVAFEVASIADDVEIRAVLHPNQDDPRFGGRGNPNLSGAATSQSGTAGLIVEAETTFESPWKITQILNPIRDIRHALNRRVLQRERSCSTQEYLAVG